MTLRGVIVIFIMTIVLSIMVLGYAALQQRIDIQGEATVDSTYRVEITSVGQGTVVGNARSTNAPQYNGLNASFFVGLTNTTDTIAYNIEITNYSTVDIKLNELSITVDGSNYIKASKLGISNGDIMLAGSTKNIILKVKYDGEAQSSEQTGTVTLNFNFTRLKGGTGQVTPEVYTAYEIGDIVSFAGSNWYVIKDSSVSQDYVVLIKENVLSYSELGEYATTSSSNKMSYYWSDTCHTANTYGYTDTITSGCSGHNDYEGSNIKECLEETYTNTLGDSNLKKINGYKIRLLTKDEFENLKNEYSAWLFNANVGNYWTMTKNTNNVYFIRGNGTGAYNAVNNANISVRPVINLYKDAIDE